MLYTKTKVKASYMKFCVSNLIYSAKPEEQFIETMF